MSYEKYGFVRVAAIAPHITLANPSLNAKRLLEKYEILSASGCSVVLSPELSITGYTCEDLFLTDDLLSQAEQALALLARKTSETRLVVGAPLRLMDGRLVNAAVVLGHGKILGAVPKVAIPNHEEFYEARWFASGDDVESELSIGGNSFRVSIKQIFRVSETCFAVEVCEDLWMPQPPSAQHALHGATIILNPSASPEQVAKSEYRRDLVRMQSGACIAAYVYASSGNSESTKDVVYGGHLIAAENAVILGESSRFQSDATLISDIDWQRLRHERTANSNFRVRSRDDSYRIVGEQTACSIRRLQRKPSARPFVPDDVATLNARASEILDIQINGLVKRIKTAGCEKLVLGLSGGVDSTLAFLVCLETCLRLARDFSCIHAVTMPGPGTSAHTLESVQALVDATDVQVQRISICDAVKNHLDEIEHDEDSDVTFENAQARERTQILFDLANKHNGIVVGTGDLSELALGWCTFNADHMSSYNVNVSVPKSLIEYLVLWYASHRANDALREALKRVLETPISPELLPSSDGEIQQKTEDLIGPFELHDFFLYHFLRTGAGVEKINAMAKLAFTGKYESGEIRKWLYVFFERFYRFQFKRTTLPPGPKCGTVSLSPRGDWRMPDEADWTEIKKRLEQASA